MNFVSEGLVSNKASSILIVEDNQGLGRLLHQFFNQQSFECKHVTDGESAFFAISQTHYDVVILDVNLPGINGFKVCEQLKQRRYPGKILMLTTNRDDESHIKGLTIGADDYVPKPIEPRVLLARVNNLLRRNTAITQNALLKFGQLQLNTENRNLSLNGQEIELTNKEFEILQYLAEHAGTVINRDAIFKALRGIEYDGVDRSIDLAISRLRKKLQVAPTYPKGLQTIHGKGYLFAPDGWIKS